MTLFHFSEDPTITVFEPHIASSSNIQDQAYVWAIDEWHSAMYLFPRDCPRACFYPGDKTTDEDRERFLGGVAARMVICVEAAWLDRIRSTTLYRYTMPEASFALNDATAGHWVSRATVTPLSVEPVGDLLAALAAADVELRVTPSLIALWERMIASTLEFSGTRLRNATGWSASAFAR